LVTCSVLKTGRWVVTSETNVCAQKKISVWSSGRACLRGLRLLHSVFRRLSHAVCVIGDEQLNMAMVIKFTSIQIGTESEIRARNVVVQNNCQERKRCMEAAW